MNLARRELYSEFAGRDDLFFDIGAYIGDKTQTMLDLGASKVVSVEPYPGSVVMLRRRFGDNSRVEIIPKGLAATSSVMTLNYDVSALTVATFSEKYKSGRFGVFEYLGRVEVEMTTLNALIERFGIPAFCKIDVEGFERQVLSGLSQPLPALCYEYAIEFEDEAQACAKLLVALGDYEFNFAEGQNARFIFPRWSMDIGGFFNEVSQVVCTDWKGLLWGDVYARLRGRS